MNEWMNIRITPSLCRVSIILRSAAALDVSPHFWQIISWVLTLLIRHTPTVVTARHQLPGKWHVADKISPESLPSGVSHHQLTTVTIDERAEEKAGAYSYIHLALTPLTPAHLHACQCSSDNIVLGNMVYWLSPAAAYRICLCSHAHTEVLI